MTQNRYAYRLRGGLPVGRVTSDYAAKAPATASLFQHIRHQAHQQARREENYSGSTLTNAEVRKIAAEDYQLITYVLVEETEFADLQESADWLRHLENAGVDNWEGISFAYELQREEKGEEED